MYFKEFVFIVSLPAFASFTLQVSSDDSAQVVSHTEQRPVPFGFGGVPQQKGKKTQEIPAYDSDKDLLPGAQPPAPKIEFPVPRPDLEPTLESELEQEPEEPRPLVFIGINSKLGNSETRDYHRDSWLQHPLVQSGVVQARFIVSRAQRLHPEPEDLIRSDVVRLPVPEDYHQLTKKTIVFMKWFLQKSNASYAFKLDDDSYPHLDRLIPILRSSTRHRAYIGGDEMYHAAVRRDGKWGEKDYQAANYPPYMQGAAYGLSRDLVEEIVKPDLRHESYANENVTVGVRVNMVNEAASANETVTYVELKGTLYGCRKQDVFSMNWDPREFPTVFDDELKIIEEDPSFRRGSCGNHPRRHWSETEGQTGR